MDSIKTKRAPDSIMKVLSSLRKPIVIFGLLVVLSALGLIVLIPDLSPIKNGRVQIVQWQREAGRTDATLGPDFPNWVPLHAVSYAMTHAVVASEDARFYDHPGIDLREIYRSFLTNVSEGRYARGASTITQQVVKMAILTREKTLGRKVREALGALVLEHILPKDEILEWYLNLAEFGNGVYGIHAAAQFYFNTSPGFLTTEQAINLAIILPSPNYWSKGLSRKRLTEFGHNRFATIVGRLHNQGILTSEQRRYALATGDFGRPIQGFEGLTSM